jgi:hypothetical protein
MDVAAAVPGVVLYRQALKAAAAAVAADLLVLSAITIFCCMLDCVAFRLGVSDVSKKSGSSC